VEKRKKLKIVFYTDDYLPAVDGTVNYIVSARKELERRGHRVYIFTAGNRETQKITKKDRRVIVFKGISFTKYPQYTIAAQPQFASTIKRINPDIIHMHTPFVMGVFATMAKKVTGAPLIGTFHTMVFSDEVLSHYLSKNKFVRRVAKSIIIRYLRYTYSKCDLVLTPSDYTRRELEKIGIKRIQTLHTGTINRIHKKLSMNASREKLGQSKSKHIMLYLGRVSHEKNIEVIIRAAKALDKNGFDIVIAGSGPAEKSLKEMAAAKGASNVMFVGFIPKKQLCSYYSSADVFCNPSMFETLGQTTIEAMAEGVPVLVPKHSAQEEFTLRGNCGETFNVKSTKDLIDKAVKIVNNRNRYSPASVARKYSVTESTDILLDAYYRMLSEDDNLDPDKKHVIRLF
jgi:1,2-diacylglycerol 3-alpha-glucosyltransferase